MDIQTVILFPISPSKGQESQIDSSRVKKELEGKGRKSRGRRETGTDAESPGVSYQEKAEKAMRKGGPEIKGLGLPRARPGDNRLVRETLERRV